MRAGGWTGETSPTRDREGAEFALGDQQLAPVSSLPPPPSSLSQCPPISARVRSNLDSYSLRHQFDSTLLQPTNSRFSLLLSLLIQSNPIKFNELLMHCFFGLRRGNGQWPAQMFCRLKRAFDQSLRSAALDSREAASGRGQFCQRERPLDAAQLLPQTERVGSQRGRDSIRTSCSRASFKWSPR